MNIKKALNRKVVDNFINYKFTLNNHKVAVTIADSKTSFTINKGKVKECDTVADALAEILKETGAEFTFSKGVADAIKIADEGSEKVAAQQFFKSLNEDEEDKVIQAYIKAGGSDEDLDSPKFWKFIMNEYAIAPYTYSMTADSSDVEDIVDELIHKFNIEPGARPSNAEVTKWLMDAGYVSESEDGPTVNNVAEAIRNPKAVIDAVITSQDAEIEVDGKKVKAKKFKTMEEANSFIETNPTYKVTTYQDPENSIYLIE